MEIEIYLSPSGDQIWHEKNNRHYWHREDGPAYISNDGSREWWYYYDFNYADQFCEMPLNLFLAYCKWEYKKNGK